MKIWLSIGLLLFGSTAMAQSAEDQLIWLRLWSVTTSEDVVREMHNYGFSKQGATDLVAFVKRSDEELNSIGRAETARICASKDTLKTQQDVAAAFKVMVDKLDGTRHRQITVDLPQLLRAADEIAWAKFRDESLQGEAVYTDLPAMILSGEVPADRVLARACSARSPTPEQ